MAFKKHVKHISAILIFLMLAVIITGILTKIFVPKYLTDQTWADTSTYLNFYKQPEESIDIIFLGSSRAVAGFDPDVLEAEYGISSYNLGGSEQSMVISYYWLLEALRFQSPQAVIIDVNILFSYRDNELNSTESSVRKALDYMKWSSVKAEAVRCVCETDGQSLLSYYFPLYRYHSRWNELEENDFLFDLTANDTDYKGHSALTDIGGDTEWTPFATDDYAGGVEDGGSSFENAQDAASGENAEDTPLQLMSEYLEKMASVCAQNNMELILVSLPYGEANSERYENTKKLASDLKAEYLDFSAETYYNAAGLIYSEDMADSVHLNQKGAEKVSSYLGKILNTR